MDTNLSGQSFSEDGNLQLGGLTEPTFSNFLHTNATNNVPIRTIVDPRGRHVQTDGALEQVRKTGFGRLCHDVNTTDNNLLRNFISRILVHS